MLDLFPLLSTCLAFGAATVVLVITPGPDMTLFLGRALSADRAAGLAAVFGASSGVLVHTVLAVFGISALIAASTTTFMVLKIGGAFYLLWLAWQAVRRGTIFMADTGPVLRRSLWLDWATGVGINLLNPKIIMFFMTFFPQFVSANDPDATGKMLVLSGLFLLIGIPIATAMVVMADRFALLLRTRPRLMRLRCACCLSGPISKLGGPEITRGKLWSLPRVILLLRY